MADLARLSVDYGRLKEARLRHSLSLSDAESRAHERAKRIAYLRSLTNKEEPCVIREISEAEEDLKLLKSRVTSRTQELGNLDKLLSMKAREMLSANGGKPMGLDPMAAIEYYANEINRTLDQAKRNLFNNIVLSTPLAGDMNPLGQPPTIHDARDKVPPGNTLNELPTVSEEIRNLLGQPPTIHDARVMPTPGNTLDKVPTVAEEIKNLVNQRDMIAFSRR